MRITISRLESDSSRIIEMDSFEFDEIADEIEMLRIRGASYALPYVPPGFELKKKGNRFALFRSDGVPAMYIRLARGPKLQNHSITVTMVWSSEIFRRKAFFEQFYFDHVLSITGLSVHDRLKTLAGSRTGTYLVGLAIERGLYAYAVDFATREVVRIEDLLQLQALHAKVDGREKRHEYRRFVVSKVALHETPVDSRNTFKGA